MLIKLKLKKVIKLPEIKNSYTIYFAFKIYMQG